MIITDVESIILRQSEIEVNGDGSQDTVLVLVHTDEGITGIGEIDSSPYIMDSIIHAQTSHEACMGLREVVVGEDAMNIEKIWQKMYYRGYYYGRRGAGIQAMSGIDIAIWDAVGKKLGLPVSQLLGGTFRTQIPAYCSVLMPEDERGIQKLVDTHMDKGYRGMKLGWGGFGESYEKDAYLVSCARKALGNGADLMVDIEMRWDELKGAMRAVRSFENDHVYWIEEPFRPDDLESFSELRDRTDIRITAGEEVGTMYEYFELIDRKCIDIVQPDMSRCGGLSVARKLRDYAFLKKIPVVPHAFKTNILMAASLQLIASLPEAKLLEFCEQDTPLRQVLTTPIFSIRPDGIVEIPQRPGIGVELNMDAVEKYRIN